MADCGICGHPFCEHTGTKRVVKCRNYMPKPKPITNADRIRAMSDEELADFLANRYVVRNIVWCDNEWGELTETQKKAEQRTMYYAWLKWCKRPADEERDDDATS